MAFTLWLGHMSGLRMESLQGFFRLLHSGLPLSFYVSGLILFLPWVVLGNGLSKDIAFIQWYEVTGVAGGTLWILFSNLFLSRLLTRETKNKRKIIANILLWSAIVILPAGTSVIRFNTIRPSKVNRNEAVIIQPDFDPYTQKFSIPFDIQLAASLKMAESGITERTRWIVAPETLIDDPVNEDKLEDNKYVKGIKDFVDNHPGTAFVTGMVSFCKVRSATGSGPENTISYFNSAFKIDTGSVIEIYHKSRLVPGFEFVPAGKLMQKISKVLPEIGLKNRNYGTQPKRSCFLSADRSFKIAPVICYESVYGEYVTDYIKEGAEAIFIITNDGWWKNTNGYKQHLSYASLRAIETRKPVIRSANTGISCFMDIRGKIVQKTKWWTPALLKGDFYPDKRITPYVRFGDYLMRAACILSLLTIIVVFVIQPLRKRLK